MRRQWEGEIDCHAIARALQTEAAMREIPLEEIAPLQVIASRIASRARLSNPEYVQRRAAGLALAREMQAQLEAKNREGTAPE